MKNPPKIFHVNWFRTGSNGKFLWPGFGDNLRVLEWVLERVEGKGEAQETPIGFVPTPNALDLNGLDVSREMMKELLAVDSNVWPEDLKLQEEFYAQFGDRLPREIKSEWETLRKRLDT